MYKNLISSFFVGKTLIHSRPERLQKCEDYILSVKNYSSETALKLIKNKIISLDATFMIKWRQSDCDEERFTQENEKWIHRILEVQLRYFL